MESGAKKWVVRCGANLQPMPWRNGLGVTREIAGKHWEGGLLWQVSVTDLTVDAAFSHYPDCDRVFTPILGDPPPELSIAGGAFELCPLLIPKRFAGDVPTLSRIPAPSRAFNVVADRRHLAMEITIEVLAGNGLRLSADVAVVFCHHGAVTVDGLTLAAGDSAVAVGSSEGVAAGTGTVLAVALRGRQSEPLPFAPER